MHRFVPRHKYNKVKLPLKPGYYDPDVRIIYTVFEEFCKWFEFHSKTYKIHKYDKFKEIYDWWQSIRLTPESYDLFDGFPADEKEKEQQKKYKYYFMYLCDNVMYFWH